MKIGILLLNLAICTILVGACATAEVEDEVVPAEEEAVGEEEEVTLPAPDVIFFNGQVVTMEPDIPQAEAIAIKGEDILAVGSDDEIRALSGPDTQEIDLEGRAILPGFVDTHTHLFRNYVEFQGYTLEEAQQVALKDGTTTHGEMMQQSYVVDQLLEFEQQGDLSIRTNLYMGYTNNCGTIIGDWYKDYPIITDPTRMLRIIGIKLFADGGTCDRPAYSFELPEEFVINDPKGDLYYTVEELATLISRFQEEGYQVATHALGDRAVETVLNAIELALEGQPNTYRHRIEHSATIRPELLSRFSEIGAIPTVGASPVAGLVNRPDNMFGAIIQQYPETYPYWLRPVRQLIDANPGLPIAWHTDRPVLFGSPITDLYVFVTRKAPEISDEVTSELPDWEVAKAITVEEALRMMTIDAAYALFMEEKIGSLKPGKFADLVILSENPLVVDPDDIINIQVLLTMVGGKVEYCAPGFENLRP